MFERMHGMVVLLLLLQSGQPFAAWAASFVAWTIQSASGDNQASQTHRPFPQYLTVLLTMLNSVAT